MEEILHIPGLHTGILHGGQSRMSEKFTIGQTFIGRILHAVKERSRSDSDDGNASHIFAKLDITYHNRFSF